MSEGSLKNIFPLKEDNIINKDNKSLKDDIIFFKEELLKEINILQKNFSEQKEEFRAKINGKLILYDETIEKLNTNFSLLKSLVEENKYLKEQIENWHHFKSDISSISTGNDIRLTLLEKETTNNFYRIDKLLSNSIIYPRLIGKNARFKNFHEFIDYTLEKISTFDIFKSKIEIDLQSFKVKVDKIIQALKLKLDSSINDARQIVKNGVKENEIIIKDYITGKIWDLQLKNNEFEKKIEKNLQDFNLEMNAFDEKMKLIGEKIEEKMSIEKFSEEKDTIYKEINQEKNIEEELNKRINNLEKYKEMQDKKSYWMMKTFRKRKNGNNNMNSDVDFMNYNNMENFKNNLQNNGSNLGFEGNNDILNLNLGDTNNKFNNNINENENISVDLNNNNKIKLNKVMIDQNVIANNEEINDKRRKNSKKDSKTMRSLYKLRISLHDINAQFNLGNLNNNLNTNQSLKDNFTQNFPMTTPISNKYINFNELFSFSYKNQLKNILEPKTLRNSVSIKNKELKFFYDDIEPKKMKNNDIITEGPSFKNKNKKSEEHKKTWERLLSPKKKKKSDLNILDTYFVKYRSLKKNKTMSKMKISLSSKNFFDNYNET